MRTQSAGSDRGLVQGIGQESGAVSGIWWSPSISITAPSFRRPLIPGCQKPGGIVLSFEPLLALFSSASSAAT